NLPQEPIQVAYRNRRVERNVPNDMLIMAFHIDSVTSPRFRGFDLLSSILSKGSSSRLIYQLTKKRNIFTFVDAYVESQMDKGLLLIMGMPSSGVTIENAEVEIWKELDKLTKELVEEKELQKVKNAEISTHIFGQVSLKERATNLATFELMGNVEQINIMEQSYEAVTAQEIMELAKEIFKKERCSSLYYCAKKRDKNG
ncbi:MAG: insulinase family protein, partial [Breznakibacter sp.]|nr:insulinase family protein [Breznakibacter sp.]